MVDVKPILKVATIAQSAALANKALKLSRKKKAKLKDFVDVGVTTSVGAMLIKEQDDFINSL